MTSKEAKLKAQISDGLLLSVFIPFQSQLGQTIASQHFWSELSLNNLFQNIFNRKDLPILVQDHGLPTLIEFTMIKITSFVRSRFCLELKDQGYLWNCLEVDDRLVGFKRLKFLENNTSFL